MGVQKIMWFTGWGIINLDTLFQVNVIILNLQQQLDLFQRFKNKLQATKVVHYPDHYNYRRWRMKLFYRFNLPINIPASSKL